MSEAIINLFFMAVCVGFCIIIKKYKPPEISLNMTTLAVLSDTGGDPDDIEQYLDCACEVHAQVEELKRGLYGWR